MGKNRWEINSSFNVTAADIIKAYSPPLWGHTHGHCPSSDALTHGLEPQWAGKKHCSVIVPEEHSYGLQELCSSDVEQKVSRAEVEFIDFVCFGFPCSQTKCLTCCKLGDFCLKGSSIQYESIRFWSGSDRARRKLVCFIVVILLPNNI